MDEKLKEERLKIALRIKSIRIEKKISQKRLAANCGITEVTYINLEKGKNFNANTILAVLLELDLLLTIN